jgi:arylsulfatase A-like enzyme
MSLPAVLVALLVSAQEGNSSNRLNVVLIVADDLGARDLGFSGSSYHKTPALDQLAMDGVNFRQAYSACPVCSPSRAAILTGRHPARFGLTDWLPGRADLPQQRLARPPLPSGLPLDAVTLAEILGPGGYATGHIGKWHLGGPGLLPTDQGFQSNVAGDATGTPRSYMAPFRDRQGNNMPGLADAPAGEYLTDRLTSEAEKFIAANRAKPFFLHLAHYAPHTPLVAKKELVEKFNPARRPGAQDNPVYAAMLASLDESVGRVRQALLKAGVADKTVIVFTSDNGGLCTLEGMQRPATTNAPLREGKGWLYEGGVRVPLLLAGPGIAKGAVSDQPVWGPDLVPTLTQLAGNKVPEGLDGTSLVEVLKDPSASKGPTERALWWHYPHYSNQMGRPGAAIRKGRWKYVSWFEKPGVEQGELYDLQADPGENSNRILSDRAVAEELDRELKALQKSADARAMTPNPAYRPGSPNAKGEIVLPAKDASVEGVQLRFEPLPHKNTLGFWVRKEDTARWEFTLDKGGLYQLDILQGCGKGSGNAEVAFVVGDQELTWKVEDTGHFQNFVTRSPGKFQLTPGRHTLQVKPKTKPGVAVMDLREARLIPVKAAN